MHLFVPLALVPEEQADPAQVIAADSCYGSEDMRVVEAFSVDAFVRAWIDLVVQDGSEASGPVRLRTGRTGYLARAGLEA
ncbi:MAG TPA: hypothetical protein VJ349_23000, partial [Stellaceae bacterium]|nr:hypothetical protein [Stellaceae bacterium]